MLHFVELLGVFFGRGLDDRPPFVLFLPANEFP